MRYRCRLRRRRGLWHRWWCNDYVIFRCRGRGLHPGDDFQVCGSWRWRVRDRECADSAAELLLVPLHSPTLAHDHPLSVPRFVGDDGRASSAATATTTADAGPDSAATPSAPATTSA